MLIKNIRIFTPEKKFKQGSIVIQDGIFSGIYYHDAVNKSESEETVIDGRGCYAIPGLIDMHLHGCMGHDFCDGSREALAAIAEYELRNGITGFAPATMTLPVEELEGILQMTAEYGLGIAYNTEDNDSDNETVVRADFLGINMEGPFISREKCGAQDKRYILSCDMQIVNRLLNASKGLVKILGIAPEECEHAGEFIGALKDAVTVSLAHTAADYNCARSAFAAGAGHITHLFNGMTAFGHREPGVIGAGADSEQVTAELICDGVHVHPSMARAAYKLFGEDRIILISDSMSATGMKDGVYKLGGQDVEVKGRRAVLAGSRALAGSVSNLMDCLRMAVKEMGIPLETAVASATIHPARRLGVADLYGSVERGKCANLVLLDEALEIKMVMKSGRVLKF